MPQEQAVARPPPEALKVAHILGSLYMPIRYNIRVPQRWMCIFLLPQRPNQDRRLDRLRYACLRTCYRNSYLILNQIAFKTRSQRPCGKSDEHDARSRIGLSSCKRRNSSKSNFDYGLGNILTLGNYVSGLFLFPSRRRSRWKLRNRDEKGKKGNWDLI